MNTIEGTIAATRGDGPIRIVEVLTSIGTVLAMVLDLGSPERPLDPGRRVRVLFKETSAVAAASHHLLREGRVERLLRRNALCELEIWWPCGQRVVLSLPSEELPDGLAIGDGFRLHVPASAVALELR